MDTRIPQGFKAGVMLPVILMAFLVLAPAVGRASEIRLAPILGCKFVPKPSLFQARVAFQGGPDAPFYTEIDTEPKTGTSMPVVLGVRAFKNRMSTSLGVTFGKVHGGFDARIEEYGGRWVSGRQQSKEIGWFAGLGGFVWKEAYLEGRVYVSYLSMDSELRYKYRHPWESDRTDIFTQSGMRLEPGIMFGFKTDPGFVGAEVGASFLRNSELNHECSLPEAVGSELNPRSVDFRDDTSLRFAVIVEVEFFAPDRPAKK